MPVRNALPYLKECLNSILHQSFTEWELIAVNDHSTDASWDLLSAYAQNDRRINIFQNSGKGIIDAVKHAYAQSSGTYISRMDADDVMHKDKLKGLLSALENKNTALATSYVHYISEQSVGEGYRRYEEWLNQLIDDQNHYDHIYKECIIPSPNWLMSRDTIETIGGFDGLNYPEDYDLAFRCYEHRIPIVGVQQKLHQWRDYPERTSRNDANYQDNTFIPLKTRHFIQLDLDCNVPLFLWGAGAKGKKIAQALINQAVDFIWISNNVKKVGTAIYEQIIQPEADLLNVNLGQVIIAVAGPDDQFEIKQLLSEKPGLTAFWFC